MNVFEDVDVDTIRYWTLLEMVVNLGYKLDEIKSIYYGELESTGGSLKILFDDESVHGRCVLLEKSGNASLFVEHTDCVGQTVTHAEIPISDSFFETTNYRDKSDETETMGSEGERCENTVEANGVTVEWRCDDAAVVRYDDGYAAVGSASVRLRRSARSDGI
nr:Terminal uridylyltransferase 7 [Ipomoea trifida]